MRKDERVKLSQEATSHGLNAKRRNRPRRIEGTITSPWPVQQIVTSYGTAGQKLKAGMWIYWIRYKPFGL